MRLFIAVRLSDEMQSALTNTLHLMKKAGVKGSYVPKQNLHLTLAFIGETKDASAVKEAMRQVKYKPFRLSFAELGTFGDLLWAGLKGNQRARAAGCVLSKRRIFRWDYLTGSKNRILMQP